jgi:hypothetical protein
MRHVVAGEEDQEGKLKKDTKREKENGDLEGTGI